MSELNENPTGGTENPERNRHHETSSSMRHHTPHRTLDELELENSRLHRLVAELLLKNQQLRKPD